MRADIVEGATLPDYELPDHTNMPRSLSLLLGDDPMILTLNWGVYCPKDRQQVMQLVDDDHGSPSSAISSLAAAAPARFAPIVDAEGP